MQAVAVLPYTLIPIYVLPAGLPRTLRSGAVSRPLSEIVRIGARKASARLLCPVYLRLLRCGMIRRLRRRSGGSTGFLMCVISGCSAGLTASYRCCVCSG